MSRKRRKSNRPPESYVSKDPAKRARQLENIGTNVAALAGNRNRLTHGGYAALTREAVDAKTREVYDALEADVPVGGNWAVAVRLQAETLIHRDSVLDYLRRRGWEAEDGSLRPAVALEADLHRRALALAKELGLTPLASRLGVERRARAGRPRDVLGDAGRRGDGMTWARGPRAHGAGRGVSRAPASRPRSSRERGWRDA